MEIQSGIAGPSQSVIDKMRHLLTVAAHEEPPRHVTAEALIGGVVNQGVPAHEVVAALRGAAEAGIIIIDENYNDLRLTGRPAYGDADETVLY